MTTSQPTEKSHYKDLLVWQKSMEFANQIIDLTEKMDTSRTHYRLLEQIEAAATSIPMNIAEGKGRYFKKEFSQHLNYARGSLYETMTLLEIFKMRDWIKSDDFNTLETKSIEIAKMVNALINSIRNSMSEN